VIRRLNRAFIGLVVLLTLSAVAPTASAAGPGLHGRILGLDDEGRYVGVVAGATIEFEGEGGGPSTQTTSGDNGYYRVDLPAGVYTYKITADGYRTEDGGRGLEIRRSEGYVVHDFSLIRGESQPEQQPVPPEATPVGLLDGRVFEINERGERIGGVSSARITLRPEGSSGLRHVIACGGDPKGGESGTYSVQLPAGEWRASVSAAGFATLVFPDLIPINDGQKTTRDFLLRRTTPVVPTEQGIRGIVLLPRGTPQPKIRIRVESLLRPQSTIPSLTPGNTGRFKLDLPAGNYRVLAEADGFHPASRVPVTVFEGRYTNVVLRLTPHSQPERPVEPEPLRLAVLVQERTPKGLVPIGGVRVLLRRDGDALAQALRSDTDAKGAASFDIASEGNFSLLAQAKGFKPGGLKLHVGPGEPNRAEVILLRVTPDGQDPLVTVNGSVAFRDPQNPKQLRALPRTRLVWRDAPQAQPVQTADSDEQGAFTVQLPAGAYVVELQPPAGFRGDKVNVAVAPKMAAQSFILEPLNGPGEKPPAEPPRDVQVAGVVVGSPLLRAGQFVSIPDASIEWKGTQTEKSTRTDRAGRFAVALPPGLYDVRVRAKGYDDLSEAVIVQPGIGNRRFVLKRMAEPPAGPAEPLSLNIRVMQRAAAVPLRRPGGAPAGVSPLANAEISILQKGQQVATGRSDRAGKFSVQVKPGAYDVRVTQEGYVPGQAEVALTTMPESLELTLTRSALPENPQPPQGKHTLTLRIVEQAAQQPAPGETPPPQTQPDQEEPKPPAQKPDDRRRKPKDASRGGLQLPPRGGSPLEQLQQRSQRDNQRQGAIDNMLRPAVKPIAAATIVIRQGENVVAQGTADRNGVYRVQLDPGAYDVKVSAQGFAPGVQSVRIADSDLTRQIVLQRGEARR